MESSITAPLETLLIKMESEMPLRRAEIQQSIEILIQIDREMSDLIAKNLNTSVRLNIGGSIFTLEAPRLLSIKDTLFYKYFYYNQNAISKELFIDRPSEAFPFILSYLQHKSIDYDSLSLQQLKDLQLEAEYYEIADILAYLSSRPLELEIVKVDLTSDNYSSYLPTYGSIKDLSDQDKSKGYMAFGSSSICFELNYAWKISKVLFAYINNDNLRYADDDDDQKYLSFSLDGKNWTSEHEIPKGIKDNTVIIKCKGEKAKFIRIESSNGIGVGYFKVIPV